MHSGQKRGSLRGLIARVAAVGACAIIGAASASAQPECVGDCGEDGAVSIAELIRAVNISLGSQNISTCPAADENGNGTVAINELIKAVNNSLFGCNVEPPTPTPTPIVYSSVCSLAEGSSLALDTGIIQLPLLPEAEISIDCEDDGNDLSCSCGVDSFEALQIIGIGDVCIEPFSPCEARVADCDGNTGIDVNVMADHNVGPCTSTANCASVCDDHCDGLGAGFFRQNSTCEDFCLGGSNDGNTCTLDAQCPGGSCGGPEGGSDGNICECVCAQAGGGTGATGGLSCGLGVSITVELDGDLICGNTAPSITLSPTCGELTTNTSTGFLAHAANTNATIPLSGDPSVLTGVVSSCDDLRGGSVSGATMVGHLAFFGSAVGDILSSISFVCE